MRCAILEPRGSVSISGADIGPGDLQDCVVVAAFMAGKLSLPDCPAPWGLCSPGPWTLEVQDHALGRLLQRDPSANIDDVLWEAHSYALKIEATTDLVDKYFFLPARAGGFLACLQCLQHLENDGEFEFHVQARTWFHRDAILPAKVPVATTNTFGHRLGDNVLLPLLLRHRAHIPEGSGAEEFFAAARSVSARQHAPSIP